MRLCIIGQPDVLQNAPFRNRNHMPSDTLSPFSRTTCERVDGCLCGKIGDALTMHLLHGGVPALCTFASLCARNANRLLHYDTSQPVSGWRTGPTAVANAFFHLRCEDWFVETKKLVGKNRKDKCVNNIIYNDSISEPLTRKRNKQIF